MLKLTYSDADVSVDYLDCSVEAVVAQRSIVAVRAGRPLTVESGYGSFTLPADLPGMADLKARGRGAIDIAPCDDTWLEVTLPGAWLADGSHSAEGIFVAELGPTLERQLVALWQQSLAWVAAPCRQGG